MDEYVGNKTKDKSQNKCFKKTKQNFPKNEHLGCFVFLKHPF